MSLRLHRLAIEEIDGEVDDYARKAGRDSPNLARVASNVFCNASRITKH
jgi:hypothetical protein